MHIEFLVEEPSMEVALYTLVSKILGNQVTFYIHPFQGKQDLLKNLPDRLKAYKTWIPDNYRIVVIIDRDQSDCFDLKNILENEASRAGFITKTSRNGSFFQVLNRLAIEELEAWFFGEMDAVRQAYPRVPRYIEMKAKYRDPDSIKGGTWENMEKVLQKAGYFRGGLAKKRAASEISKFMEPSRNRSKSFQVFRDGLLDLTRSSV